MGGSRCMVFDRDHELGEVAVTDDSSELLLCDQRGLSIATTVGRYVSTPFANGPTIQPTRKCDDPTIIDERDVKALAPPAHVHTEPPSHAAKYASGAGGYACHLAPLPTPDLVSASHSSGRRG
jgi:hypothetical protein